MDRIKMINIIGNKYLTSNIENGEYSYVKEAGGKEKLEKLLGRSITHYKLDIRLECEDVVILIETKNIFEESDKEQLNQYLLEEKALHKNKKIICILANINNDDINVWKDVIDDEHFLATEKVLDTMEHYKNLFVIKKINNREKVLKNTYNLNILLHKKDIDEKLRSQFVATSLLYIGDILNNKGITEINEESCKEIDEYLEILTPSQISKGIEETLNKCLSSSTNKTKKEELLQKNILENQKVKNLATKDWVEILDYIIVKIYKYIDINSSEGQDILNMCFIAFNKYTGKADKNQAFTPDHLTEFMCCLTNVDRNSIVLDCTCGSGSFLVQALVKELADCNNMSSTATEKEKQRQIIKNEHIFGIEIEEKAYGLAITNMLIHNAKDSNIVLGSLFDNKEFIKSTNPNVILMNPPYNAKPTGIPAEYKRSWGKSTDAKEDPTKGLVFVKFVADCINELINDKIAHKENPQYVKLAVLLPTSAAIGNSEILKRIKTDLLKNNTLEAVLTLPDEIFYPGASVNSCCMLFTIGKPHVNNDGTVNKTFFGYYKEDGHKKKKNIGRIEQYDNNNISLWKQIESEWLTLFRNKEVVDGKSAMAVVSGADEWLCEAYMKTNYLTLCENDFKDSINNYASYLVKHNYYPDLSFKPTMSLKLDISSWKEYNLNDLFDSLEKGKCNDAPSLMDGEGVNYIGAKYNDNGVMKECSYTDNCEYISKGNCIIMIGQGAGSAGYSIYMDKDFIGSTALHLGYAEWINQYTGLFVATVLCKEYDKYSFGRSWNKERLKNTVIKLPSDKYGNPDWDYMENYIKSLPYGNKI